MSTSTAPSAWPAGYYRRRYVWQWPIRLSHWINALCIVVLFATGEYIAHPQLAPAGEAYKHFVMGRMREIHFAFAFVFLISFLWRIYWFWMGNNYARSGFPFIWRTAWWRDLTRQARAYLSLQRGHVHLGHNALAGLIYFGTFLAFVFQTITGFALYSSMSSSWLPRMFTWIVPLMGGEFGVRFWHHLFLWFFVTFVIVHVYLAFYHDYIEGRGTVSSIIGGWKFEREKRDK